MTRRAVLVVDDERTFDPARLGIGPGDLLVHARTSAEGLRRLRQQAWDKLWLDFDLSGRDDVMPIVEFLTQAVAAGAANSPPRVIVHTANPDGARTIRSALAPDYPVRRIRDVRPLLIKARTPIDTGAN